jgi:hypothetical protein
MTTTYATTVRSRKQALALAQANGHAMSGWRDETAVHENSDFPDLSALHEAAHVAHCTNPNCQMTLVETQTARGRRVRVGRLKGGLPCPTTYRWPLWETNAQKRRERPDLSIRSIY